MNRRIFVQSLGAMSIASSIAGAPPLFQASFSPYEDQDRSPERDPITLQKSTLVVNGLDGSAFTAKYLDMLASGGVNCYHRSVKGLDTFAAAHNFIDAHADRIITVTTADGIRKAVQDGKLAVSLGWQSAGVLSTDAQGEAVIPSVLRAYYAMGLRIVSLLKNLVNNFGGGCLEQGVGLTRKGRTLVEEIHKLRIILDVGGHTGERTTLDAIEMSSGVPVVCTHSNVAAINDNPRCISDRVIEGIASTGGLIGITAFNDFHARRRADVKVPRTPQVGLEKHLDQYDYVRKLVGVDHVALGPDFIEGLNASAANPADMLPELYSEWPWQWVRGFENISQLPNVTAGLIQRGWSTGEIKKVLGDNWMRVYQRVWGA